MNHSLSTLNPAKTDNKTDVLIDILSRLRSQGYEIAEINIDKPWGLYVRLASSDADQFIKEFFPGLSPKEARLGIDELELSPKVLLAAPDKRLSWQYHHRRAERWAFLTAGSYNKSFDDEPGESVIAEAGSVVQFEKGERHRLNGMDEGYVVVAEIWQHTDPASPSDEDDIVRLYDDYAR